MQDLPQKLKLLLQDLSIRKLLFHRGDIAVTLFFIAVYNLCFIICLLQTLCDPFLKVGDLKSQCAGFTTKVQITLKDPLSEN